MDPRQVPISGVDFHLPAVAGDRLTPVELRQRFASPPPWTPEIRQETPWEARQPTPAAVLVGLVLRESPTVLLTQRTSHLPTHASQIAFPGGKVDRADASPTATALREAWEEVGLSPDGVEILGQLPDYATGSSFVVTPVVGLVSPDVPVQPNPQEVAEIFEVPLAYLMNPAHHRRHEAWWEGRHRQWYSMPYYDGGAERYIWGVTAGMLRNLYRLLIA
jgi:8-oxo-dGTP pyrophosphatase MutT (NUDIX family)